MRRTKIGNLAKQIRGVSYKPEDLHDTLDSESVVLLRANNIDDGKINFDDVVYVDRRKVADNQYLKKGDILICASSGSKQLVGKAASILFDKPCTFGAFCKVVRPEIGFEKYLGAYFQSDIYRRKISEVSIGININNIRNEHIDSLELPIYSNDTNNKIVSRLMLIQSIIDKRKNELNNLDNLIKARFVEMFYDKNYPKSTISELAIDKVSSVKKDFQPSDIIKYIDISSIDNEKNIMTGYTEYVLSKAPSRAQQHIIKDDIVISTVRPNLHNVAMTTYTDNNLVASSGFCVLRAVKCIPEYLMAIVVSDNFTDAMSKIVTGANYPAIKNSDIMNYIVSVPPIEKQEEFASFVKQVDKSKFVKINLVICKNIIYYRISWFF